MFAKLGSTLSGCNTHMVARFKDRRHHKALLTSLFMTLLAHLFFGSWGAAQGLTNIATQVCTWAPTVANIGLALGFIVFIAGLAMITVGSRDGFGRTIWAVLGSVALFGATALFTALTGTSCGAAGG